MKQNGNTPSSHGNGKLEQRAQRALRGFRETMKDKSGFLGADLSGPSGSRFIEASFMSQDEIGKAKLDAKFGGLQIRAVVPKRFAKAA